MAAEISSRRDARRNREAILAVARDLFSETADFAMSEVARRAGVGQGTLYRHFPDRADLAAAVMEEHVERLREIAAQRAGDPDAFFVLMRALAETLTRSYAVRDIALSDAAAGSALERTRRQLAELVKGPLRDAKATGLLRRDLTADDVVLIVKMIRGALDELPDPAARAAAATRALSLVLEGTAPAAAGG
jgi:AcrR family transcriptional regulator